jgi:hypothetical protein
MLDGSTNQVAGVAGGSVRSRRASVGSTESTAA